MDNSENKGESAFSTNHLDDQIYDLTINDYDIK